MKNTDVLEMSRKINADVVCSWCDQKNGIHVCGNCMMEFEKKGECLGIFCKDCDDYKKD